MPWRRHMRRFLRTPETGCSAGSREVRKNLALFTNLSHGGLTGAGWFPACGNPGGAGQAFYFVLQQGGAEQSRSYATCLARE